MFLIKQPKRWPDKIWYLSHRFASSGYKHQIRPSWELKPGYLTNKEILHHLGLIYLLKTLFFSFIYLRTIK